jgi:methyl-accepting chemotaxis protein
MKFQLTIARKLFGLSLLAFVFLLTVGVAGLVARHYLTVSSDRMLVAQEVLHHQMAADQAHDALRADVLAAMLSAREIDQEERKAVRADVKAHGNVLRDAMQKLDALELDDANRAAVAKVRPTLDGYVTQSNALVEMAYSDPVGAQSRMEGFLKLYRQLESEMNALSELIEQRARDSQADSRLTSERSGQAVTVVIALASLVLLLVSWAISRSVVRRINQAVEIARTVATGDLSSQIEVKGSDEAAQLLAALARMNSSLVQLVGTVRQSSDNIAAGSVQIANGNQDLSQRTEEQASNLQQTAASMEQISATVRTNADTTRQASAMAATVSQSAARSGDAVGQLVTTMAGITEASRRITDIIGVIDAIAFQTNILALNAAVEAARAGEQGRGFAVVAAEVRNLAQRSAGAAKEIKGLIATSVSTVAVGEQHAVRARETMDEVVRQVKSVTTLISEISSSTEEQTKGIAEVAAAVTQIDQVTQSNATLVEESAAAAESLHRQAAMLVEAVSLFRLGHDELPALAYR